MPLSAILGSRAAAAHEFINILVALFENPMCLAIPAQISQLLDDDSQQAVVDILGVRRKVNVQLLEPDRPQPGEWVLIHVGFAMSRISAQQAAEQLDLLRQLGEASTAREEISGDEEAGQGSMGDAQERPPA
jgi:hydrogenase expression/formation protein HypC